jgi:para-aminobenzoate synthetase / 4-amino-4-deoxychorismate lyase
MNRRHSLPTEVYALVEQSPATVLLECGNPSHWNTSAAGSAPSLNSQLFIDPLCVRVAYTSADVPELFAEIESAVAAGRIAAGYFSYECGNSFEPKAGLLSLPLDRPLAWFGVYERSYVFDHAAGAFEGGAPPQLQGLRNAVQLEADEPRIDTALGLTQAQYAERIKAIHEWIRAGDVYQLNFTVPYTIRVNGSVAALYAQLRDRQPVEYGAFIHTQPGRRILSFSPELFFRIDEQNGERRITTRPMKGTAARGRTTQEDGERAEWLCNDPKNRAENLMIVDLLRNDLGRLAKFGTVRTEHMFAVERHPTLWQMTSTITADLRREVGFRDIFRALFPCGSITGAPKVRAMQLLAQLEEQPRGVYTGAIGFFSPNRAVFNVAIRTLEMNGNEGTMGVGSGIVIDSVAAEEYAECALKAQFLRPEEYRSSVNWTLNDKFLLIETMLWDGGFPLMELHLDRLTDSAEYFGIRCERAEVKKAIEAHAQIFVPAVARKVRLLLDAEGELNIGSEPLQPGDPNQAARVCIASGHTRSDFKWLYHKTTHREAYALAYRQAAEIGYDDVLFLNERDEVTEGAISNVITEKDGRLFTPPVKSGLLPGVYRRHLLETRPNIEERVVTLDDLRAADAVYICNAVRGLLKVQIEW